MPSIQVPDFQLPAAAKASAGNSPQKMVDEVFDECSRWFSRIIPQLEEGFKSTMRPDDGRLSIQWRLGTLVSRVETMGKNLENYVNRWANSNVTIGKLVLPFAATAKSPNDVYRMVAAAYQELQPWFEKQILFQIKALYLKKITVNSDKVATESDLNGLVGQLNQFKDSVQQWLNNGVSDRGFSAGDDGEEEAEIPEIHGNTFLTKYLDVEIAHSE